jgi:ABC-type glycerol-3-phosphate transport system permease component
MRQRSSWTNRQARRVNSLPEIALVRGDVYFWGSLMGGCFIASVPIAILYNFFLDRFISGFTVGAVK